MTEYYVTARYRSTDSGDVVETTTIEPGLEEAQEVARDLSWDRVSMKLCSITIAPRDLGGAFPHVANVDGWVTAWSWRIEIDEGMHTIHTDVLPAANLEMAIEEIAEWGKKTDDIDYGRPIALTIIAPHGNRGLTADEASVMRRRQHVEDLLATT
jgi:hypothetical protein